MLFTCGLLLLLCMVGIIALIYHKHMKAIYKDIAEKEAQEIADRRFRQMIQNARIKVIQRLEIIDEMKKR